MLLNQLGNHSFKRTIGKKDGFKVHDLDENVTATAKQFGTTAVEWRFDVQFVFLKSQLGLRLSRTTVLMLTEGCYTVELAW